VPKGARVLLLFDHDLRQPTEHAGASPFDRLDITLQQVERGSSKSNLAQLVIGGGVLLQLLDEPSGERRGERPT